MSNAKYTDAQLKKKYGYRFPNNNAHGCVIFDEPCELGYSCPKGHNYDNITWSEFNEHIWCYTCEMDYLSFDCPIKRPCWMSRKTWDDMYVKPKELKYNIKKGRIHPYPDCKKDGKYHRCVK